MNNPNGTNLKLCADLILSNNVMLEGNVHNMPFPPNTLFLKYEQVLSEIKLSTRENEL